MIEQVSEILILLKGSFLHLLPYMLITIPIAVAVNMSGASKHIGKAMKAKPVTAIFLAMVIGAFSPLCSCGVIPVVWSLLVGGVPLAPVMVFWLASPSMDPEIFFLSASMIGWELAIWRLLATMFLSLGAEGEGLRRRTKEFCDVLVRIPGGRKGVESLNAGIATSVALAEFYR